MDTPASSHPGFIGSIRGLAEGVIGSVHDRLELFSVELHEEKHRLVQLVIWISALVVLALLAIVFASLALVVVFWETARVAVVLSLAGGYLIGAVAVAFGFKRFLARQTKPFAGTLAELREDRACIREES
jgi:uncharacterized membrane protein YqjE